MPRARRGAPTRGPVRLVVAVVSLLIGFAALGLWRVSSGSQDLPFDDDATPPTSVQVTKDVTYSLAVPGGVKAMEARGVPMRQVNGQMTLALQCTWSSASANGTSGLPLGVTAEGENTKATNTVGRFYGPTTGRISVACSGWGAMFVPDSDDRAFDWGGLAILIAIIGLTVGGALALSELRVALERSRESRESDEVDDDSESYDGGHRYDHDYWDVDESESSERA